MVVDDWPDRDRYPRTVKLLVDNGTASSPAEARQILEKYRLQIVVGVAAGWDDAAQAALLTAVNAGRRAFQGGVRVVIDDETALVTLPWGDGQTIVDAVISLGGEITSLPVDVPTLLIGPVTTPQLAAPTLRLSWSGWTGAATTGLGLAPNDATLPLAGVVAAALGVSELFQYSQGMVEAGRRDVGLDLWQPGSEWRDPPTSPPVQFLPSSLWILGLGHLGQAAIWNLGCLPYPDHDRPQLTLMDTDVFVEANIDTGLLADATSFHRRKTRVVGARLEAIGFKTSLVERRFDGTIRVDRNEPSLAIAGFDNPQARRLVEKSFSMTVDAGLGAGPQDYLDILIHSFPGDLAAGDAFPDPPSAQLAALPAAYEQEVARRIVAGEDPGDARCGVVEVAGATVGAAFVGAIAGALAVADVLRWLHDGPRFSVVAIDLAEPQYVTAVRSELVTPPAHNPGFVEIRHD